MKLFIPMFLFIVVGCANNPAPQAPGGGVTAAASAKPEATMAIKHLKDHVKYPASRTAVLAACADTPEFSAAEKKWLSDNLPERTYVSADEVASALRL
jgi:hypothetical protein